MDAAKNFGLGVVATAPTTPTSGTLMVLTSGHGALMPATPFNATVWPAVGQATSVNAEIVRVTNITSDTLTITRAREGTSARAIVVGDQVAATITAQFREDLVTELAAKAETYADSVKLRQAMVLLTDSQIKALMTTPVSLVPAAGANLVIVPTLMCFRKNIPSVSYTNVVDGAYLYTGVAGDWGPLGSYIPRIDASGIDGLTQMLTAGATYDLGFTVLNQGLLASDGWNFLIAWTNLVEIVNKPIVIGGFSSGGNFTGGAAENTIRVTTFYHLFNAATGMFV